MAEIKIFKKFYPPLQQQAKKDIVEINTAETKYIFMSHN